MNKELDKLYNEFGKDFILILTKELKKAGKDSSGKLINSLNEKLKTTGKNILVLIESEDYLINVDQGRKKGSYPPISSLKKWLSLKGIPQEAAFPIAKKIFEFGIKPTNVIEKTKKEFLSSTKLSKKYESILGNEIEKEIIKEFEKIK